MIALVLLLATAPAHAACGDAERATPVYQALNSCHTQTLPVRARQLGSAVAGAGSVLFCRAGTGTGVVGQDLDPSLCRDPNGFVCSATRDSGNFLDSKCRFIVFSREHASQSPAGVRLKCGTF